MNLHPGWPATLREGPVGLRPMTVRDASAWVEIRRTNEAWLAQWEPRVAGRWPDQNSRAAFRSRLRLARRQARRGEILPFAVTFDDRLAGQLTVGNIARGAFQSAYAGYWIDQRLAGRGIIPAALALAVDHCFSAVGLHRVEVNIRPENAKSLRVVEKLGFRQESNHPRYLHIDGEWRDHVGFAVTTEDIPGGLLRQWRRRASH